MKIIVKVSVIIVSYNVKYFLEQSLCSVKNAIDQCSMANGKLKPEESHAEVIVVDNNSSDGSLQYLQSKFPFVRFISNHENTGFARANNQALQQAKGQFILFLNPDTILPGNFFSTCIPAMENAPGIGALGVQMIDGTGTFLQESKRGFPTTWASFCKLSGLTALFPNSAFFAKYYLGHLDRNGNHEVDALSGACMLVRKDVLDRSGGFDERFFMYAEDIDLSFEIRQSGYINYYLAEISIIHFKGESTKKDARYVKLFYKAMIQFVQKHYHGTKGGLYTGFLKMAIWFRSLFAFGGLRLANRQRGHKNGKQKIFFAGDGSGIKEVQNIITGSTGSTVVQSASEANEIVLCEGRDFSFSEIIETMKLSPGKNYKIHALHSSSVVGSDNSRGSGTT
ncbi:MAG: glycosyltransferase [Chitinophagaceae bacterium]|nr:glycosyltransferase [Chitinophagaceae bacterium]